MLAIDFDNFDNCLRLSLLTKRASKLHWRMKQSRGKGRKRFVIPFVSCEQRTCAIAVLLRSWDPQDLRTAMFTNLAVLLNRAFLSVEFIPRCNARIRVSAQRELPDYENFSSRQLIKLGMSRTKSWSRMRRRLRGSFGRLIQQQE